MAGAAEPLQVELDHRHADHAAVPHHRLRDVVAGLLARDADGVEAPDVSGGRLLEIRPEQVLGADKAVGQIVVGCRQGQAARGDHVGGGGAGAVVDLAQVAVGARDIVGRRVGQQVVDERMQRDQRRQVLVAVERALEVGGVAVDAGAGGLLGLRQAAVPGHHEGGRAHQRHHRQQAGRHQPPEPAARASGGKREIGLGHRRQANGGRTGRAFRGRVDHQPLGAVAHCTFQKKAGPSGRSGPAIIRLRPATPRGRHRH